MFERSPSTWKWASVCILLLTARGCTYAPYGGEADYLAAKDYPQIAILEDLRL
jgi:hypothetical protein